MVNKLSMISNHLSKSVTNLLRFSASFSYSKPAHIVGEKPIKLIDVPMAEWIDKITEQYPKNICINSYSQNVSFTYEKCH